MAPVPPEAFTLTLPVAPPIQDTGVAMAAVMVGANWFPMATGTSSVHPIASVTVTLYEPAPRFPKAPDADGAPPLDE